MQRLKVDLESVSGNIRGFQSIRSEEVPSSAVRLSSEVGSSTAETDYASVNPPITGFALTQWRASRLVVSPRQWRYLTTYVQGIRHQRSKKYYLFEAVGSKIPNDVSKTVTKYLYEAGPRRHSAKTFEEGSIWHSFLDTRLI
ncbi:unnamed protein product [Aspergillus oryzae]|uniref:Unnamed protein product n=2 Tax=Aspergillus oryzae TaxID=5062 RepID=A0AAN5BU72_ASPOZ|nr:unnamed protein product [Aspergillus oryzae]GMF84527.1 unnamed protein product [Aspergillus oryzae]GMG11177.1 unnamed protein product [Aspergillus oryzae]GMG32932.1 unnamed protein product [Aspergillus oryzae]GMG47439.1 unnamed protein product [Aspergillus oryzae var. brunneus]